MKKFKSAIVLTLVVVVLAFFAVGVNADGHSVTIDFESVDDMMYFEVPADSNGTWEIKDGMLWQTTPIDYNVEITNGAVFALKQFITLKGQSLKDFTIEFDYYVATMEESIEEVYGWGFLLATNVPDGQMSAKSAENGGYGLLFYDPTTTGGNKKYELYDLKKGVSDDFNDWVFNGVPLSSVKKHDAFLADGKHTFKMVKVGNNFEIFYDGSSYYETNKGPVDFLYEDAANLYTEAGAVQLFSANGAIRIDNMTITSPQLNMAAFTDDTEVPQTFDGGMAGLLVLALGSGTMLIARKRK